MLIVIAYAGSDSDHYDLRVVLGLSLLVLGQGGCSETRVALYSPPESGWCAWVGCAMEGLLVLSRLGCFVAIVSRWVPCLLRD